MATLNFANPNSGPLAAGIGWFDFTGVVLPANTTATLTNSLPNGGSITFDVTNTNSQNLTFTGVPSPQRPGMPFGTTNYTGIAGKPIFNLTQLNFGNAILTLSDITITDANGATIPYGLVVAEAEGGVTDEFWTWNTNGSPWNLIANIYGSLSNISGIGTQTVTWGNGSGSWPVPIVSSNNAAEIIGYDVENSQSAIALGVILTPMSIRKNITNRIDINDQFELSIIGPQSATTVTTGINTGIQSSYASIYADDGGTYVINESMSLGSTSSQSQYFTTVSIVNLSQGGTTIPSNWTLGTPITTTMGDNISVIITNTPINPNLKATKTVNKNFGVIGDLLDYTIVLTNTSPNIATNTIFIDTIPNGTTLIPNSLYVNNSPFVGNPNPPNGLSLLTLPANSITTITYQVSADSAIPIINSSTTRYSYLVVSNTEPSLVVHSNIVTTTIVGPSLSSTKQVDKNSALLGDVLTYTISISNSGNMAANNIMFLDTIPNGTTLVPNSFKQDSVTISGNPSLGVTLPNPLPQGGTTTITFQVTITSNPVPNPISNTASASSIFILDPSTTPNILGTAITNSNNVTTSVFYASLDNITKYVNKDYATCGDTIAYTVVFGNTGTVTATNVIFIDTIPNGTVLVPTSLYLNGVQQPNANLTTGVTIPDISPGTAITLTFEVIVTC